MPVTLLQSPNAADWLFLEFSISSGGSAWNDIERMRQERVVERRVQTLDAAALRLSFPEFNIDCSPPHRVTDKDGESLDCRIIMQVDGCVMPICDSFSLEGEDCWRVFDNVDGARTFMDLSPTVPWPAHGLVHRIQVDRPRPDIDDDDVGLYTPPDPFALYGGGEHGFRHVYADLRRAMRLCCRDPADNYHYTTGEGGHRYFDGDADPVRRWMLGGS